MSAAGAPQISEDELSSALGSALDDMDNAEAAEKEKRDKVRIPAGTSDLYLTYAILKNTIIFVVI